MHVEFGFSADYSNGNIMQEVLQMGLELRREGPVLELFILGLISIQVMAETFLAGVPEKVALFDSFSKPHFLRLCSSCSVNMFSSVKKE